MSPPPLATARTTRSAWQRSRTPLLAIGLLTWLAAITALHHSHNRRTTKGATELLQIGALPVT